MLAARLADALKRAVRAIVVRLSNKVTKTDNSAQPLVLIDHWQAADLSLTHPHSDLFDILIDACADDIVGHELANRRVGPVAFGDSANRDIAVCNHSDQPIAIDHRN